MEQIKNAHHHPPSLRIVYRDADMFAREFILRTLQEKPLTMKGLVVAGQKNGYDITPALIRKTAEAFLRVGILRSYIEDGRLILALDVEVGQL